MAFFSQHLTERVHGNTIKTPRELYDWSVKQTDKNITKLNFCYVSNEQYVTMSDELKELFIRAKTIPGTHKFHSFIPISHNKIAAKRYSNSEDDPKIFTLLN